MISGIFLIGSFEFSTVNLKNRVCTWINILSYREFESTHCHFCITSIIEKGVASRTRNDFLAHLDIYFSPWPYIDWIKRQKDNKQKFRSSKMGANSCKPCRKKKKALQGGSILDRVISQASNQDQCLLYRLANYKKGEFKHIHRIYKLLCVYFFLLYWLMI